MSQAGQGGKTTAPTPDSITPAAECPHSGHQRARRRGARREPLEFHGFFSGCEVGAVFMSAAWTPQRASGFRGRATRGYPTAAEGWAGGTAPPDRSWRAHSQATHS